MLTVVEPYLCPGINPVMAGAPLQGFEFQLKRWIDIRFVSYRLAGAKVGRADTSPPAEGPNIQQALRCPFRFSIPDYHQILSRLYIHSHKGTPIGLFNGFCPLNTIRSGMMALQGNPSELPCYQQYSRPFPSACLAAHQC